MKNIKLKFRKRLKLIAGFALALISLCIYLTSIEAGAALTGSMFLVPIWGYVKDKTFKELTPDQVAELELDDQVKYFNELNIHKADQLNRLKVELKNNASDEIKEQIKELRDEITKDNKEQLQRLLKTMEEQGLAITKLMSKKQDVPSVKTIEKYLEENAEALKNAMNERVTIKTDVLTTSVTDSAYAQDIAGVGQLATIPAKLLNLFAKGTVSSGSGGVVRYVDQQAVTRNADWVAEAGVKPESAITWIVKTVPLETIADTIPVTNQALRDIPFIASEIRNFLLKNLALKIDASLFSGSGVAPQITGIYTYSDTYTAAASGVTDANIYDLIMFMKADITASSDYMPNVILINPSDRVKFMTVKKDSNNNYLLPPYVEMRNGTMYIDGMEVIESSRVTADTLLLGDFSYGTVYNIGGVQIDVGMIDKQFVENMVTIRAEQALALVVRSAHTDAFRKSDGIAADIVTIGTAPA